MQMGRYFYKAVYTIQFMVMLDSFHLTNLSQLFIPILRGANISGGQQLTGSVVGGITHW